MSVKRARSLGNVLLCGLLGTLLYATPTTASAIEQETAVDTPSPEARSPYRWFILVGFIAGGLVTVWRIRLRARRKSLSDQRSDGDLR